MEESAVQGAERTLGFNIAPFINQFQVSVWKRSAAGWPSPRLPSLCRFAVTGFNWIALVLSFLELGNLLVVEIKPYG